jgi:hypothetical protein
MRNVQKMAFLRIPISIITCGTGVVTPIQCGRRGDRTQPESIQRGKWNLEKTSQGYSGTFWTERGK